MSCWQTISDELVKGNSVVSRFGTFILGKLPRYEGENPRTKQKIIISAKTMLFFIPSDEFLEQSLGTSGLQDASAYERELLDTFRDKGIDVAISKSTVNVACSAAEFEQITSSLKRAPKDGKSKAVDEFGEFLIRNIESSTEKVVISFTPSGLLRDKICCL